MKYIYLSLIVIATVFGQETNKIIDRNMSYLDGSNSVDVRELAIRNIAFYAKTNSEYIKKVYLKKIDNADLDIWENVITLTKGFYLIRNSVVLTENDLLILNKIKKSKHFKDGNIEKYFKGITN